MPSFGAGDPASTQTRSGLCGALHASFFAGFAILGSPGIGGKVARGHATSASGALRNANACGTLAETKSPLSSDTVSAGPTNNAPVSLNRRRNTAIVLA